jgi:hypothetical protein
VLKLMMTVTFLGAAGCVETPDIGDVEILPQSFAKPAVIPGGRPLPVEATNGSSGQDVRITGIRLTKGNAVDCPQVQDDAGVIHSVSYLSPAVAIGARVTLTGQYAITTRCVGTVLVVRDEQILEN